VKLASSPLWKQIRPLRAPSVEFGPPVAISLVHFVVAGPGELDNVGAC
jgi:hypothetical protein